MAFIRNKQVLVTSDFDFNGFDVFNIDQIRVNGTLEQLTEATKLLTLENNTVKYVNPETLLATLGFGDWTFEETDENNLLVKYLGTPSYLFETNGTFHANGDVVAFSDLIPGGGTAPVITNFSVIATDTAGSISADVEGDTLNLSAGNGISFVTDDATNTLTIAANDPTSFTITNGDLDSADFTDNDTLEFIGGNGITINVDDNNPTTTVTITGGNDTGSSQNIFKNFAVAGQSTITADNNDDTLTLVAGTNITITTNDDNDSITINGEASANNALITLAPGAGLTGGGDFTTDQATPETITFVNSDPGSAQNIFKNVTGNTGTTTANSNNDTLNIIGTGSVSTSVTGDTVTISAADTNLGNSNLTANSARTYTMVDNNSSALSFDTAGKTGMLLFDTTNGAESVRTTSDMIVDGNLIVNGTTTTVNSETVEVADNILLLNSNVTGSPTENSGIEVERGTSANVSILWNEANDFWTLSNNGTTFNRILTVADEGSGNGLDADTLDGQEGTFYLDYNNFNNTPTIGDGTITLTAGTGMTIGGDGVFTLNQTNNETFTITNNDRGSSQNIFKNFAVDGQTTITADSNDDTLTLVAGTGITITTDADTDSITINSTGAFGGGLDNTNTDDFLRSNADDTFEAGNTLTINGILDVNNTTSITSPDTITLEFGPSSLIYSDNGTTSEIQSSIRGITSSLSSDGTTDGYQLSANNYSELWSGDNTSASYRRDVSNSRLIEQGNATSGDYQRRIFSGTEISGSGTSTTSNYSIALVGGGLQYTGDSNSNSYQFELGANDVRIEMVTDSTQSSVELNGGLSNGYVGVKNEVLKLNTKEIGSNTNNISIVAHRGNLPETSIRWNETTDKWEFTNDGTVFQELGSGSGGNSGGGEGGGLNSADWDFVQVGTDLFLQYLNNNKFLFTEAGDFHADGNVIANSTSVSDKKFKEDISSLSNKESLDKIMNLKPSAFTWKKTSKKGKKDFGFIAQEVEKVLPEAVQNNKNGFYGSKFKSVDYAKLTSVLTSAMQEQQRQIEELRAEIKKLKELL